MSIEMDMKVLRAIHLLSTSGSVTKTAEILQVTPGAVSYLINKARKSTGSALFFRTRDGMKPNTLALELSQRYLGVTEQFSEGNMQKSLNERTIVLSTYSLFELLLSITLLNTTKLTFSRSSHDDAERLMKLRNKEVDVDIGSRLAVDSSIVQLKLFSSDLGALVSKNHPTIKETFTMEDWHQNRHIIWSRGMQFISDNMELTHSFRALFDQQEIAFVASSSLNVTALCAYSDLVILLPLLIGKKVESLFPVKALPLPAEMKMSFECYVHYHHSFAKNENFHQLLSEIQKVTQNQMSPED
ncbi:LysR family transcriptional regulator [Rahnella ecdela]|uniref:LysR family transcriptional regulator n=1 Tax=Rahnella ecdela TaxID=2816250 RepID=A0ABS6LJG5_9GAMM|nr:LysR family transcriptional regulator [Rahnella ecdela]MBU9847079.1 LysR family transcriptional regulator [Rahnella ecdela]